MKKLLTIAALFLTATVHGQTATKDAQGNYHAAIRTDTASNKPTGKTFTDKDGKVYPLFLSAHGRLFYMRTSRNGNVYKAYIKVS